MHKSNEPLAVERTDPTNAVTAEPRRPWEDLRFGGAECARVQTTHLDVIDREICFHLNRASHASIMADNAQPVPANEGIPQTPQSCACRIAGSVM